MEKLCNKKIPKRLANLIGKKIKIIHTNDSYYQCLEGRTGKVIGVIYNEIADLWILKTNIDVKIWNGSYYEFESNFEVYIGSDRYKLIKENKE